MIEGRRWKTHDNVLLVVGNTDLYNEREYVLYLEILEDNLVMHPERLVNVFSK